MHHDPSRLFNKPIARGKPSRFHIAPAIPPAVAPAVIMAAVMTVAVVVGATTGCSPFVDDEPSGDPDTVAGDVAIESPGGDFADGRDVVENHNSGTNESFQDQPGGLSAGQPGNQLADAPEMRQIDAIDRRIADMLRTADQSTGNASATDSGSDSSAATEPKRARLVQLLNEKLAVADRMMRSSEPSSRNAGSRIRLQTLSGLVSIGDRTVLPELRNLVGDSLQSTDWRVRLDAAAVGMSIASEDLAAGDPDAPKRLVTLSTAVRDEIQTARRNDQYQTPGEATATLVSLGSARRTLAGYGDDGSAGVIRGHITELYAAATDPQIAGLAAQMAGAVPYRVTDQLLDAWLDGQSVPMDRWTESLQRLIDVAPDLQTVRYLASAGLELESHQLRAASEAIERVLRERFPEASETNPAGRSAASAEAVVAVRASQTRRGLIGRKIDFSARDRSGKMVTSDQFTGRRWWIVFHDGDGNVLEQLTKAFADGAADDQFPLGVAVHMGSASSNTKPPNDGSFIRVVASDVRLPQGNLARSFGIVTLPHIVGINPDGEIDAMGFDADAIVAMMTGP